MTPDSEGYGATLCAFCFDVIAAATSGSAAPSLPSSVKDDKYPLFVTWYKGGDEDL